MLKEFKEKKMVNMSIYLPREWIDLIDKAVRMNLYASRSEMFRCYIRKWLEAELEFANRINLTNKLIDKFVKSSEITLDIRKAVADIEKIESERVITDCDGNNWNIKELVNSPKLTHKKGINEV
jgi:Arc/MetJ-type ribon-helix-helix transcriptional regulator